MRRVLTWFLSTAAVVALLFGYRTSTGSGLQTQTAPDVAAASPAAAATTAGAAGGGRTFTGSAASTRWGDVQVAITVANGRITAVTVPEYPDGNGRDAEINSYALPKLVQNTLANQNAEVDMISGATVTSDGYVESLQSALDQAGLS